VPQGHGHECYPRATLPGVGPRLWRPATGKKSRTSSAAKCGATFPSGASRNGKQGELMADKLCAFLKFAYMTFLKVELESGDDFLLERETDC